MKIEEKFQQSSRLTDIFGQWPSFHDAEVLRVVLDRSDVKVLPSLEVQVHVWEITPEVVDGKYVLKNYTLATIRFDGVVDLSIVGFNHQNVLWNIDISDISDYQIEQVQFEVNFRGTFGMDAKFKCSSIEVVDAVPYL